MLVVRFKVRCKPEKTEQGAGVKGGEISYHVGVDVQRLCQGNGPAIMSVVAVSSQ